MNQQKDSKIGVRRELEVSDSQTSSDDEDVRIRRTRPPSRDISGTVQSDSESVTSRPREPSRNLRVVLSDEQETELARWWQKHELLYKKKNSSYRKTDLKEQIYQEKADELDIPVEHLKQWMKTMRTIMGKISKEGPPGRQAGELSDRNQWILRHFSFLKDHIARKSSRHKPNKVKEKTRKTSTYDTSTLLDTDGEGSTEPPVSPMVSPSPATSTQRPHKARRVEAAQAVSTTGLQDLLSTSSFATTQVRRHLSHLDTQDSDIHSRVLWAEYIMSEVKKLPEHLWEDFQHQVNSLLYSFKQQARQLQQQALQQPSAAPSSTYGLPSIEEIYGLPAPKTE